MAACRIDLPKYLTHYCIVRADLPIGVQAAQLIHAAGYSSPGDLPAGTYAVALHAKSEAALRSLAETLERAGHRATLIIEADAPYEGQAMALGIFPADRKALKRYLSSFPLIRGIAQCQSSRSNDPADGGSIPSAPSSSCALVAQSG